jgi:hypothetical protein
MITDEYIIIQNEGVVAYFKELVQNSPGQSGESHRTFSQRFKHVTS